MKLGWIHGSAGFNFSWARAATYASRKLLQVTFEHSLGLTFDVALVPVCCYVHQIPFLLLLDAFFISVTILLAPFRLGDRRSGKANDSAHFVPQIAHSRKEKLLANPFCHGIPGRVLSSKPGVAWR
jgi:hypothetical protein